MTPASVTLSSIAITTPATKLAYTVGDTLDLTGLVVTRTYSDNSTTPEAITLANVSGFNSSVAAASQTLTITVGGKTATYTISIAAASAYDVPVTGVTLNHSTLSLTVGGSNGTLKASVMPANATNQGVTWSSSNPSAATVNNGVVTPVAAGNATITVTTQDGDKTATCAVTVAFPITTQTVTADTNNKNLAVTASTPEGANINIPSNVTGATISVATLPAVGGTLTTNSLPALNIAADTSISASPVQVAIPAGTTISAPAGWDGTIHVPTVQATNSVTVSPSSGTTAAVYSVIEIGFGDVPLTFNNAIRILIPGQAGKKAGYVRSGTFYPISTVLSADDQSTVDSTLADGQDGYLNIGSDLVIWTKHFTKFVTYTETPVNNGGPSAGGGGSYTSSPTTAPVIGSVIDGTTGAKVSNLTATVTADSNGNATISMQIAQTVMLKQADGSTTPINDLSKVTITSAAGMPVTISADGTIQVPDLAQGTDNNFKITYELGNGQKITIGTMQIKIDSTGNVTLT